MHLIYYIGISVDNPVLLESLASITTEPRPKTTLDLFPLTLVDDHDVDAAQQLLDQCKNELGDGIISIKWKIPDNPRRVDYEDENFEAPFLSLDDACWKQMLSWRDIVYQRRFWDAGLVDPTLTMAVDVLPPPSLILDRTRMKWNSHADGLLRGIEEEEMTVNVTNLALYFSHTPPPKKPSRGSYIGLKFGDGNMISATEPLTTDSWPDLSLPLIRLTINDEEQWALAKNLLEEISPDLVELVRHGTGRYDYIKSLAWQPRIVMDADSTNDDALLLPTVESWSQFKPWYELLYQRFSELNLVDTNHDNTADVPGMWLSKTRVQLFTDDATFCPTNLGAYGALHPAVFSVSLYKDGQREATISPYNHGTTPTNNSSANLVNLIVSPEFWRHDQEHPLTYEEVHRLTHLNRMWKGSEWTDEMIRMFVHAVTTENTYGVVDTQALKNNTTNGIFDLHVDSKEDMRPLMLFCVAALYAQVHGKRSRYAFPVQPYLGSGYATEQYLRGLDTLRFDVAKVLESRCGVPVFKEILVSEPGVLPEIKENRWCLPHDAGLDTGMVKFLNCKTKFSLLRSHEGRDWCIKRTTEADIILTTPDHSPETTRPGAWLHVRCIAPDNTVE